MNPSTLRCINCRASLFSVHSRSPKDSEYWLANGFRFIIGRRPFSKGSPSHLTRLDTSAKTRKDHISVLGANYVKDEMSNVTESLLKKVESKLHLRKHHPLGMIKSSIENHMHGHYRSRHGGCTFAAVDNLSPVVTTEQNFDSLLVPKDHISRLKNDNYYINKSMMLRAHTSAHQRDLIKSGWDAFLVTGDVYRRDEIDKSHYPVFHQMEGVKLFSQNELFSEYVKVCCFHYHDFISAHIFVRHSTTL